MNSDRKGRQWRRQMLAVIGGLSFTALTLLVLPVLYEMIETQFGESQPQLG